MNSQIYKLVQSYFFQPWNIAKFKWMLIHSLTLAIIILFFPVLVKQLKFKSSILNGTVLHVNKRDFISWGLFEMERAVCSVQKKHVFYQLNQNAKWQMSCYWSIAGFCSSGRTGSKIDHSGFGNGSSKEFIVSPKSLKNKEMMTIGKRLRYHIPVSKTRQNKVIQLWNSGYQWAGWELVDCP